MISAYTDVKRIQETYWLFLMSFTEFTTDSQSSPFFMAIKYLISCIIVTCRLQIEDNCCWQVTDLFIKRKDMYLCTKMQKMFLHKAFKETASG